MTASPTFIALSAAAAWFLVFFIIHAAGLRAGLENARWLLMSYAVSVLGTLLTVILALASLQTMHAVLLAIMLAVLASACLFVIYVPALYTVLTSISVQTLMLLRRSGGALPEADLYKRFAGTRMLENRLATLLGSGYIATAGPSYRLTPRGRAIAKIFGTIKVFWKLGPGG